MEQNEVMEDVGVIETEPVTETPKKSSKKRSKAETEPVTEPEANPEFADTEEANPTDDEVSYESEHGDDTVVGYEPEEEPQEDELEEADYAQVVEQVVHSAIQTAMRDMFQGRRVYRATKEQRKDMYLSENDVVSDKSTHMMTEKDYLKQESDILMTAAVSKKPRKILSGRITGFGTDNEDIMCAKVQLDNTKGKFKVLIPVSYLFPFDYENEYARYGEKGISYFEDELVSRIGGHITFTITKVLEKERIAYGCRLEAMAIEAYGWYRFKQEDGEPKLKKGMKAYAEVISVRDDRIKVYVLGAETTIKTKELSWTSLGVIRDEFHMGDKFPVYVEKISDKNYSVLSYKNGKAVEKRFDLIDIVASKRKAEPEPKKEYFKDFEIGNLCGGIITNIDGGKIFVNLFGKMDCVCNAPAKGVAAKGIPCVVEITEKRDKDLFIYGKIRSMG